MSGDTSRIIRCLFPAQPLDIDPEQVALDFGGRNIAELLVKCARCWVQIGPIFGQQANLGQPFRGKESNMIASFDLENAGCQNLRYANDVMRGAVNEYKYGDR